MSLSLSLSLDAFLIQFFLISKHSRDILREKEREEEEERERRRRGRERDYSVMAAGLVGVALAVPGPLDQVTEQVANKCTVIKTAGSRDATSRGARKEEEEDANEEQVYDVLTDLTLTEQEVGERGTGKEDTNKTAEASSSSSSLSSVPARLGLGLTCGTCGKIFENVEYQRAHFASDFHRLNVKRSVAGKGPLTEDLLEAIINAGDCPSISASGMNDECRDVPLPPSPLSLFFFFCGLETSERNNC